MGFQRAAPHGLIGNVISAGWSRDGAKVERAAVFIYLFIYFLVGMSLFFVKAIQT